MVGRRVISPSHLATTNCLIVFTRCWRRPELIFRSLRRGKSGSANAGSKAVHAGGATRRFARAAVAKDGENDAIKRFTGSHCLHRGRRCGTTSLTRTYFPRGGINGGIVSDCVCFS